MCCKVLTSFLTIENQCPDQEDIPSQMRKYLQPVP